MIRPDISTLGIGNAPATGGTAARAVQRPRAGTVAEARFALAVLAGGLAAAYLAAALSLPSSLAAVSLALAAMAVAETICAWAITLGRAKASLWLAAAGNAALALGWVVSRTALSPFGSPQPVGVPDALVAVAELALVVLALGAALPSARIAGRRLLHAAAIALAAISLSVVIAGHTHGGRPGAAIPHGGAAQLYCRLL